MVHEYTRLHVCAATDLVSHHPVNLGLVLLLRELDSIFRVPEYAVQLPSGDTRLIRERRAVAVAVWVNAGERNGLAALLMRCACVPAPEHADALQSSPRHRGA